MSYSHAGRLLRIDLSAGDWQIEAIPDEWVENYLLGSGLAAKIFYEEIDPGLDPLDPASPLLAFNGLLSGTFAPTACRSSWCGRSPLTGIWGEANMGGHWGAELRFSGYDGLIIKGQADEPVYLWINGEENRIELRPAGHLWGLDHYATVDRLQEETDPKARVACIGPAGENLVRFAAVMTGGQPHSRAAGRTGMGAIMGSKKLKAIVVRGQERPQYYDRAGFQRYVKESNAWIKENSIAMSQLGTAGGIPATEQFGDIPLQNWRMGSWKEGTDKISGQVIHETMWVKHTHCFACPIGCGKEVEIKEGPYKMRGHGPEYETIAGFGGMTLNDDIKSIAKMNDLCNRYGMDTISTSAVIAFAMETYEKGILTKEDTDGIELTWGNAPAIIQAIEKIAHREGLGDLLADGVRATAQRLGKGTEDFAIHVKGMEMPYHDPRAFVSMAANYATSNRGACHLEAVSFWPGYGLQFPELGYDKPFDTHDSEGKAQMTYDFQNYQSVYNPLGLCKFIIKGLVEPGTVAQLVNLAMGWNWTPKDVMRMGEKIFNLKRMINIRYGITARDDVLPKRFLTEPRPSGHAKGALPDLDKMLPEYYRLRGWTEEGVPTEEKLAELGLL